MGVRGKNWFAHHTKVDYQDFEAILLDQLLRMAYNCSMFIPILATKLYISPPRAKIVLRPHLIERLNEGLSSGSKLTLISASAGFGKTTLVSECLAGSQRPVAWLSLDEGDNDPTRFLTYFIAALQTLTPETGGPQKTGGANIGKGALAALQSPQPPSIESILTALLNEITTVQEHFILVLDDYHVIDSKPVDAALTFLIEHLPPQMHMVIATREDPHLPLARLRARGQLTELRAADLRFNPTEAAEFLNRVMGLNLSAEDIAALETRTEGWIAGLQLAALAMQGLSMQGRSDAASFIQAFTGSQRFVLDYLVEEVLQRQPEHIRSFLLQTAILERFCAPLCNAVTEREHGKKILDVLERNNLFLIPLDDQRQWYRYHPLFAEVLQSRLLDEQPDQVLSLHQRASEWYEHNGSAAEAIRHALAAKNFERAAILVELAVPEMRRNRQGATVTELGWLKALPDELIYFRPVLCVDYAYALFGSGEIEAVEARLRDAERWLDTADPVGPMAEVRERPESPTAGMVVVDEEEFRRLPGMIALLRTAHALARGDMPETVKNARRVLDLAPDDAHLMLGGAASSLGLVAWTSGDLDTACQMTVDGMEKVRLAGYISSAIGGALVLAEIQIAQGRLHEAMTTFERGLQWATEPGTPVLRGAADMYVGMSDLHREHNDLKTATQLLLTSQTLGELAGLPQNPYRWCAAMARIRVAQGDLDGALDLLDQAGRLYNANFSPNIRPIATRKTRVWVAQGRLDKALGWGREQGLSVESELSYLHEFDQITLARVLLALYRSDRADRSIQEALGLLERLLKAAEERGGKGSVIEILVLQATAYHAQGDIPAALNPLQKALRLAEPEGYFRIFVDEGLPMAQLLAAVRRLPEASAHEIMPLQGLPTYTDKLLAAFEAEKQNSEDTPDLPPVLPAQTLIEPLSERELEVLKLLRSELTGPEIAQQLIVSINTFRTHTKNIFSKLGVSDRRAAIRRGEELNLF
jgi:LuxR family transcriptional regulator, maltose regulon positive regulatory protein